MYLKGRVNSTLDITKKRISEREDRPEEDEEFL